MDLLEMFRNRWRERLSWRRCFSKLHLHSKLVLVISVSLILLGFLFFLIVEWSNPETLGGLSGKDKVLGALFQSVSTRTAGFNSISQEDSMGHRNSMTIILMFIGGSSGGTAGRNQDCHHCSPVDHGNLCSPRQAVYGSLRKAYR
ncbi:MAG: potassium transporter TrkG [Clostridia bacterium]